MARLSRIMSPSEANRREWVFFEDGDYALYPDLLAEASAPAQVAIWAYVKSHIALRRERVFFEDGDLQMARNANPLTNRTSHRRNPDRPRAQSGNCAPAGGAAA
jgi:hypothetical protein